MSRRPLRPRSRPRRRDRVRAGRDRIARQADDVVARGELDRLDPARTRLVRKTRSQGFAAPGAWVPDDDGVLGPWRGREFG